MIKTIKISLLLMLVATFTAISQDATTSTRNASNSKATINYTSLPNVRPLNTNIIDYSIYDATWYIKLNLAEIKKTNLMKIAKDKQIKLSQSRSFNFKQIPENIDKLYVYGNHLKRSGNISFLIKGTFSDKEILDLITNKFYTINGESQLIPSKPLVTRGYSITTFERKNAQGRHKKMYAKRLNDGTFMLSNNVDEIRKQDRLWKRVKKHIETTGLILKQKKDLLVLNINTELALQNMNEEMGDKDEYVVQSKLFNLAKNIVARVNIKDNTLVLAAAFATKNSEIAQQIEKILNGIIAYNSINQESTKTSLQTELLNNLFVERKQENVLFNTFITIDKLSQFLQTQD